MIAQVWIGKMPAGPLSDEARKYAEEAVAGARSHDGVEASISTWDPATGESWTIVLFRDEAALDAYDAFSKEKIAEAEGLGEEVSAGRVYSEVIAAL